MPDFSKLELTPPVAILASGVLVAGAIIFTNYYTPERLPPVAAGQGGALSIRPPSEGDHWRGSREASIILVEFSDFECPFCASIHPTLSRIVEESEGGVAWVYRHFPLESIHSQARPAAIASECVAELLGNDAFWAFADRVFSERRALGSAYYTQVASELGADGAAFSACVALARHDAAVTEDLNEALGSGGQGTPFTIVVAGDTQTSFSGALPYTQIKAVISAVENRQR